MVENILIVIFTAIAVVAGIWAWRYEHSGSEKKK